jgi:ribose 1,5-bisphosphokinase PhnN
MNPQPRYLIVIGPSGAGKSSVVRELQRRAAVVVRPTWTTRRPRREELDGSVEHRFTSESEFDDLLHAGFFCQTGTIAGLPFRYGLPGFVPRNVGPVDTVILRARHVERLTLLVPCAVVYQIQDQHRQIAQRLRARRCPPSDVDARIRDNVAESIAGSQVSQRRFDNSDTVGRLVDKVVAGMEIDFPDRFGAMLQEVAR